MNKDNKSENVDNTDKKLHISDVMKRIGDLEKEYLEIPNNNSTEEIKWIRKHQIELIFDELGLDLPHIIMKGCVGYVS
jgi:hypothetical protein